MQVRVRVSVGVSVDLLKLLSLRKEEGRRGARQGKDEGDKGRDTRQMIRQRTTKDRQVKDQRTGQWRRTR